MHPALHAEHLQFAKNLCNDTATKYSPVAKSVLYLLLTLSHVCSLRSVAVGCCPSQASHMTLAMQNEKNVSMLARLALSVREALGANVELDDDGIVPDRYEALRRNAWPLPH